MEDPLDSPTHTRRSPNLPLPKMRAHSFQEVTHDGDDADAARPAELDLEGGLGKPDFRRHRYPCAITWSPLPGLTCCCPCIGHMGIADSNGIIYDFQVRRDNKAVVVDGGGVETRIREGHSSFFSHLSPCSLPPPFPLRSPSVPHPFPIRSPLLRPSPSFPNHHLKSISIPPPPSPPRSVSLP